MDPNHNQNQLSPTRIYRRLTSNPLPLIQPPVSFVRRLEFSFYPASNNNTELNPSVDDYFPHEMTISKTSREDVEGHFLATPPPPPANDPADQESLSLCHDHKSSYYSDSLISQNNSSAQPLETTNGTNNKGKQIDGVTMDFKLQVLRWAYTKTIHSAGHHFNLERCVVRNWMMNEEKIYNSATEEGKRKWRNFDSRVMRHLDDTRPVPGKAAESYLITGIGDLSFSNNN